MVMASGGDRGLRMFAAGALAGVLFALALGGGFLASVRQRGVTVRVNTAQIAAQVREDIAGAVRRELPQSVETMRRELPARIANETARRLSETRLDVGGFSVPVPAAAVAVVQSRMEESLRAGLNLAITPADVDAMAGRLSEQAFALVNQRLNSMLSGQTFPVEVVPGVTVPVRVVAQ